LIRAVVPDIRAYDALYRRLIEKIDLYDVSSMFAMEQIKSTTELPLMYALTHSDEPLRGSEPPPCELVTVLPRSAERPWRLPR
jgi:hypothetical protein